MTPKYSVQLEEAKVHDIKILFNSPCFSTVFYLETIYMIIIH